MTPICPHTLSNRSIIFRQGIKPARLSTAQKARACWLPWTVSATSRSASVLPIEISVSKLTLPLAQRLDYSHFAVVRTKLKWSGGAAEAPKARA
jgi:NAD+ kinase